MTTFCQYFADKYWFYCPAHLCPLCYLLFMLPQPMLFVLLPSQLLYLFRFARILNRFQLNLREAITTTDRLDDYSFGEIGTGTKLAAWYSGRTLVYDRRSFSVCARRAADG